MCMCVCVCVCCVALSWGEGLLYHQLRGKPCERIERVRSACPGFEGRVRHIAHICIKINLKIVGFRKHEVR